jgi:hypothetical protein
MVPAMSVWEVRTASPEQKPVMMVRLYLPDMRRTLSHTTSKRVDRNSLEIMTFHDISLQPDVSVGNWLRSGTMILLCSCFCVPEGDREGHGFVAGDFVLFGVV